MTRRRWIADEVSGGRAALIGSHADYLARVLRAKVGQEFDISVGENVRRGRIAKISPRRVEFELGDEVPTIAAPNLTLAVSIFKFDRMEWAIEKCTELGAARIIPVIAQRTESRLAAAASSRRERWQRIARQAAEQSRRTSAPEILPPMKVSEIVVLPVRARILVSESEKSTMLKDVVAGCESRDLALAFGPEGGWTETEVLSFGDVGWTAASLGDSILRTETAVIAAMAIAMAELQ